MQFILLIFMVFFCSFQVGAAPAVKDASASTPVKGVMPGPGDRVTMDFQGVELAQVVRFIAEMTKKNYILDPQLKGKVTVITPTSVSVGEAEKIFESILSVHELTVVERDGAFKIVPLKSGVSEGGAPVFQAETGAGKEEVVLSRLLRMQHVDANSLAATLKPLMHPWGSLAVHVPTNAVVISDAAITVNKMIALIEAMDVPVGLAQRRLFSLRYATAATVEKIGNAIFADFNSRRRKEDIGVKLFSDARTNILVAVCAPEQMSEVESLVKGLDHPVVTDSGNLHLYYPRNSEAEAIAKVLTALMGSGGAGKAGGEDLKPLELMRSVSVVGEKSTNTLVIAATPEDYQILLPIIHGLDKRRLQVHVEALIVEVTAERAAEFGVEWRFGNVPTAVGTNALTGFGGSGFGNSITNPLDLGNGMAVGLMHGLVGSGTSVVPNIPALIRAFQSEGDVNILATPNIVTMDGVESEIIVGQNIPIVSGTTSSTASTTATPGVTSQTVERKDVGLTLRVTPRVIEDEWLEMKIFQEQSSVTPASIKQLDAGTLGSSVVTNKRSIKTTVNLKSGQTIVLGGLIKEEQNEQVGLVPCVGGLVGFGELFKKTSRTKNKSNLMVFIRPVITSRYDELVRISAEKYRATQSAWGSAESHGSQLLPALKPDSLPHFSRVLTNEPLPPPKESGEVVVSAPPVVTSLELDPKPEVTASSPVAPSAQVATASKATDAVATKQPAPVVAKKEPVKSVIAEKELIKSITVKKEPVKPEVSTSVQSSGFALQVEYGDKLAGAQLTEKKLLDKGYAAHVVLERERDGRPRFSVRIGHYATRVDAEAAAKQFKQQEGRVVYPIVWRPAMEENGL